MLLVAGTANWEFYSISNILKEDLSSPFDIKPLLRFDEKIEKKRNNIYVTRIQVKDVNVCETSEQNWFLLLCSNKKCIKLSLPTYRNTQPKQSALIQLALTMNTSKLNEHKRTTHCHNPNVLLRKNTYGAFSIRDRKGRQKLERNEMDKNQSVYECAFTVQ